MLEDDAIARYARQIVVPGIGAAGQEKLLAASVLVVGHSRGVAQAALYLEAAGVHVTFNKAEAAEVVIVAGADAVDAPLLSFLAASKRPVCWYTTDAEGFTAGLHPDAPLPSPAPPSAVDAGPLHDAAACDCAALACAIVLGLACRRETVRFEL